MPVKSDREYRNFQVEVENREDEKEKIIKGYASTFGNEYVLYDDGELEIREVIDPHAFDDTDMTDTIMQYDHQGRVFARVSNRTLMLGVDERGLAIMGNLGGTDLGLQLYQEIAGGYTDKMSVGMTIDRSKDVWTSREEDGKMIETRTVNRVKKLYDVSAVSIPANDSTSLSIRALTDGVIERIKAERLEAEELRTKRKRLEVKAKALKGARNEEN